jgi:homoserine O-succinyltransferase/O-acetyltransferase
MSQEDRSVENFAFGQRGTRATLHIGLVNNMPDAAMRATELQFARLIKEAANAFDVRLHLFSMPEIPRGEVAASRMEGFYANVAKLPSTGMDALIITGTESRAARMHEEPYWQALARLIDWAQSGTVSALFSCLAAHAAVQYMDGIVRRPLPKKLSGVFASLRAVEDPLLAGLPARAATPHSRRNGLLESDLVARNYRILSRLTDGSVDVFVREGRSRFVFLQGHPEYSAETLGREYLLDVARFLRGEAIRPAIPENYFDRVTENALQALAGRDAQIAEYSDVVANAVPLQSWRNYTLRLFANWISSIAAEKSRRRASRPASIRRTA